MKVSDDASRSKTNPTLFVAFDFLHVYSEKNCDPLSREGFVLLLLLKLPSLLLLLYLKAAGATAKLAATGVFCQYLCYTLLSPEKVHRKL
jgi:hypothetical protein